MLSATAWRAGRAGALLAGIRRAAALYKADSGECYRHAAMIHGSVILTSKQTGTW